MNVPAMNERKWVWMLAVSVGINIFGAGLLVARCSRPHHEGPAARGSFRPGAPMMFRVREAFGEQLPEGAKSALRAQVRAARQQRQELRKAHEGVRAALEADTFDPQTLAQALRDLRMNTTRMQETLHEGLVQIAQSATPEQRKRLAEQNLRRKRR